MQITKATRPHAEVALSGVLAASDIEPFWSRAVAAVGREVALPGFRKGHVPQGRVIAEVGEKFLWKEAAEMALKDGLEGVLTESQVTPIAPLSLSLKSADKGADVSFEIVAVVAPSVEGGEYHAVATRALGALLKEDSEKEIAEAKKAFHAQLHALAKLPEGATFRDEDAKKVGFENVTALNFFVEGEARKAVENRTMQKRRSAVAEALITAFKADIPHILIREEAGALLNAMKKDVAAQGIAWSEYLKRVKKTEEAVKTDMLPAAEKRIALDLIFGAINKKEGLKLEGDTDKKAEDDLAHAVAEQGVPHDRAHSYARETILREKVWALLGTPTTIAVS